MGSWSPVAAPRAQISRMPYLAGLDGLRAIAVVAVMVYHANHEWLAGGFLGVEVFFVISGYLITLLMVGEHERSGHVRLSQFWLRRARRLLPALAVMLGAVAVYMALFYRRAQGQVRGDFIAAIFYVSNWYQIFVGQGYTASEAFAPLRHLWSLAVEEQFYLLWPLVMVLLLRRGRNRLPDLALWFAGVAVLITVVNAVLYVPGDIATTCSPDAMHGYWNIFGKCISVNDAIYLNTFSRAGGLLLGAALAMVWRPFAILRGPLRHRAHTLDAVALVGFVGLGAAMWWLNVTESGEEFGIHYDPYLFRGGLFVVGLMTLFIIAAAAHRRSWTGKLLSFPLLVYLGTRSYGLYLYHWPIYQIIRKQAGVPLTVPQFALAMLVTVVITEASYRIIEMPIRRGRMAEWLRGERRPRTAAAAVRRRRTLAAGVGMAGLFAFAGVSLATADNVCVGDIECSIAEAGNRTTLPVTDGSGAPVETDPPESSAAPVSTVPGETAAVTTTPAPTTSTSTTTTVPPPPPPMQAFGDSVMLGGYNELVAGGFGVDAQESRQGTALADLLATKRAEGQLSPTIVIHIGTNGNVSEATFDRIMASLPADLTPNVRFLTVRADKGWTAGNNERINALPGRYPNVAILDWATESNNLPLCSDGVHIACGGGAAQAYANLIFNSIGRPDLVR